MSNKIEEIEILDEPPIVKKKSKKRFIIWGIIICLVISGISLGVYKYNVYQKEQARLRKEEEIRNAKVKEAQRILILNTEANDAVVALYNEDVPRLGLTDGEIEKAYSKVDIVENQEYKDELLLKVEDAKYFKTLEEKINNLIVNDILIYNYRVEDINEVNSLYNNLNDEYKNFFTNKLILINTQRKAIEEAINNVKSLFSDNEFKVVKSSVTRKKYNTVLNEVKALKQKEIVETYTKYLDVVLKYIEEQERKAREEAARKARLEAERKAKIEASWKILNVPYISQNYQQVYNGCEAASLLMGMQYKGHLKGKTLAEYATEMPKSDDPNQGFVLDIFGTEPKDKPHWIAPEPLAKFGRDTGGNVINITGSSLSTLKSEINKGNPVIVYVTGSNFSKPHDFIGGVPVNLHVVLLVGYNSYTNDLRINDPWTRTSNNGRVTVSSGTFESVYNALGKRAVTIRG